MKLNKHLDHKKLIEIMLRMSREGEEMSSMKGQDVIQEFVRWLRPFYQDHREKGEG